MSYAKNGQLQSICAFPGLETRTAYDQQMQKIYCPLAQKAYRSPETLTFETYSAPDQTNRLATPAATFSQLKNAYGLHITAPMSEGFMAKSGNDCPGCKLAQKAPVEKYVALPWNFM